MDIVANPCERVSCPFDPVHVIERSKLQKHIVKCKRNLPENHDFVQCQFWGVHYVRKNDLEAHYQTCEHALMKQATKRTCSFEPSRFKEPKLIYNNAPTPNNDDSWDIPSDQPIFRPELLKAHATNMMIPTGLPKSKRKEFREQERKRIRELEESEKLDKFTQFEKGWNTDAPLNNQQDIKPRKPNTPAVPPMNSYASSTGTSHDDSFAGSSTGHSTNTTYSGSGHNVGPQQGTYTRAISDVTPGFAPQSGMRMPGRGRALLSAWGGEFRPSSHHPHPYDGIPYKYSPNDYPNL